MPQCPFNERLSAYLDGELNADERATIARHLSECPPCRAALSAMAALSGLFASEIQPRLSQMSLYRLHRKVDAVMQEGLIRLAHVFQAIAACILLAGSLWLVMNRPAGQVAGQTPAQTASVVPVSWVTTTDESTTPAASYYLADASNSSQSPAADDFP